MGYDNNKKQFNNGNKKYNSYNKYNGQNKVTSVDKNNNFKKQHQNGKLKYSQESKVKNDGKNSGYKGLNNFTFKSDDDIYSPKVYAKKPKEKSFFDDIIIPEYLEDRQRMRNKRENDRKYKNKHNHWGDVMAKNAGKTFEDDVKKSCQRDNMFVDRVRDNATSYFDVD